MEDVLSRITDQNIVPEALTSQKDHYELKPTEKMAIVIDKPTKPAKHTKKYYSDRQTEEFIDRMIESAQQRGLTTKFAKKMGIEPRVAQRCKSRFVDTQDSCINQLVDDDPQLAVDDSVEKLVVRFDGFNISKYQLNHHMKNNLCMAIKKPTFEAKGRNSVDNL
ncbi:hypothetical protein CLU79DRAFT_803603 [Phycomyces nitens]|nr:hypothetical protein CLU79DRAFT_803603 [Phycomyces nitens]